MTDPKRIVSDIEYMTRACRLAVKGRGLTSPNPLVGTVIVKRGRIVAEGWHKRCGGKHAEIMALDRARGSLKGATMYVTLEPCFHYGRTPPCIDRIMESGISEVIIGMKDPNPLTNGKSIARLRRAGITTRVGVIEDELRAVNEAFIHFTAKKRPLVVGKTAETLDGKIATANGQSKWITSDLSRAYARALRDEFDAILVGINTVVKDDPRLNGTKKRRLRKVVLDSALRITPKARLFSGTDPADCIIATTKRSPLRKRNALTARGIQVIVCPTIDGRIDLKWLMKKLAGQEITSVLIEGGAQVIGSALKQNVVDKMHIYIAPKILGDERALSSVTGNKPKTLRQAVRLKKVSYLPIGEDLMVTGYV